MTAEILEVLPTEDFLSWYWSEISNIAPKRLFYAAYRRKNNFLCQGRKGGKGGAGVVPGVGGVMATVVEGGMGGGE